MILVVDHDPEVLDKAQQILNRDRQVFLASTSKQAFEMMERLLFSVVLVDLDLPDAFNLIQQLHRANSNPAIVAVSKTAKSSVVDSVKTFGVVEVLEKPITSAWKPVVEQVRARRAKAQN